MQPLEQSYRTLFQLQTTFPLKAHIFTTRTFKWLETFTVWTFVQSIRRFAAQIYKHITEEKFCIKLLIQKQFQHEFIIFRQMTNFLKLCLIFISFVSHTLYCRKKGKQKHACGTDYTVNYYRNCRKKKPCTFFFFLLQAFLWVCKFWSCQWARTIKSAIPLLYFITKVHNCNEYVHSQNKYVVWEEKERERNREKKRARERVTETEEEKKRD